MSARVLSQPTYLENLNFKFLDVTFPSRTFIQALADVVVVVQGDLRRQLEQRISKTLEEIGKWASQRNLSFNFDKCKYLLISKGEYLQKKPQ